MESFLNSEAGNAKWSLDHWRRRWMWAIAYYPMVVLLGVTLFCIRITDASEVGYRLLLGAFCIGVAVVICVKWVDTRGSTNGSQQPRIWVALSMPLLWMFGIGVAYSMVHHHSMSIVASQLAEWNRLAGANQGTEEERVAGWQPIVVRATLEESLRYRRSSSSYRKSSMDAAGGMDDLASDTAEQWQTLTRLSVHQVRRDGMWFPVSLVGNFVLDEKVQGYYPGDTMEIYGYWRLPPEPSNPGQFDLRKRYAELGVAVQLKAESAAQWELVSRGGSMRIDRWLARLTESSLCLVDRYVILGQAPLTAALVLGQREQADWQLQEELLSTGTIHMLSISGMHIEMVAMSLFVMGVFLRLPQGLVLFGTVVLCVAYALLCGANPPVARATIMLSAACLAKWMGWPFSSLNTLALAGLVILTQRTAIAFEVGTQLSFLTVAVLILTFPIMRTSVSPLERLLESKRTVGERIWAHFKQFAWESLRSSFWVCFLSAPLVWSSFHILSPIAVVLNLLLWLPMLVALLSGLGLILVGWIPPVGWLMGILCGVSLWMVEQLVGVADAIPLGHFWAAPPPAWWLVGFYVIALVLALWRGTKRASARRLLLWSLGLWFAMGIVLEPCTRWKQRAFPQTEDGSLAVTWVDVGHGTCALIEMPDGSVWVYDAGRLGDHERSYQPIVNAIWALGHSRIDKLVLSHADSDHYNAMPGTLKRFFPRVLITTDAVVAHSSESLQKVLREASAHGVAIERSHAGFVYAGDGPWHATVLHPTRELASAGRSSDNSKSLCLLIEYAGRSILLPGDLEPPGTQRLVESRNTDVDVLMAPHHGSLSAKSEVLVDWCDPEFVIISGSAKAASLRVVEAYAGIDRRVWVTARDHALRVTIDSRGTMRWYHWWGNHWAELPK
ncbi:MAG: ComEC/Rec2 family competence protein [Planctomycetes bacterium]|nr:ComEC/Rec2 family competence protein [Planctomycetota bacterium]